MRKTVHTSDPGLEISPTSISDRTWSLERHATIWGSFGVQKPTIWSIGVTVEKNMQLLYHRCDL